MITTIDKAGRVVVPAEIRRWLGLGPGTEIEITVEAAEIRIVKAAPPPAIMKHRGRLLARPRVPVEKRTDVDVSRLIEEERERCPT